MTGVHVAAVPSGVDGSSLTKTKTSLPDVGLVGPVQLEGRLTRVAKIDQMILAIRAGAVAGRGVLEVVV